MNTQMESDHERKRAAKRSQIYIIIAISFASIFAVVALWCFSQMPTSTYKHSPLEDALFVKPKRGSPYAGLRRGRDEFILLYGEPRKSFHGSTTPAEADLLFEAGGNRFYDVSFWNGAAHHVNVFRMDKQKLTEEDIQRSLESFSGGEDWHHVSTLVTLGQEKWERTGAAAWVNDYRGKQNNPSDLESPVNILRITTTEFWEAHKKAEGL